MQDSGPLQADATEMLLNCDICQAPLGTILQKIMQAMIQSLQLHWPQAWKRALQVGSSATDSLKNRRLQTLLRHSWWQWIQALSPSLAQVSRLRQVQLTQAQTASRRAEPIPLHWGPVFEPICKHLCNDTWCSTSPLSCGNQRKWQRFEGPAQDPLTLRCGCPTGNA